MLSIDHPIKRDDLWKDIPDNKAFYPCAIGCAKSHLKWAEAFWLLLGFKSNREFLASRCSSRLRCSSRRVSTDAEKPHDFPLRYRKISYLASSTFDFKTGYYPDLLRDLFETCSRIILSSSTFSEYASNKVKAIIEIY